MQMRIKWKYKGKKIEPVWFESQWLQRKMIISLMNDISKTGRVLDLIIEDEMGNEWTPKEFQKLEVELDQAPENITVYFDGGFDIQSSLSGLGMVVYYEKNGQKWRVRKNERLEELENNNEAEYAALYASLTVLEELGVHHMPLTIKGDSQVVLMQLQGEWPCFEKVLNEWLDRIEAKLDQLKLKPRYELIPRKQNKEADQLANQALEGTQIESESKIRE
ncbi:ribonuclease HI [Bacillus pakistanensis]|uniref:Ribonuclease HI n=1 Tax=Rossellomorea pakistanensis TaxID=992288 RepID=A0ABS2N8X9_9BACI|nr:reverse transcriptase-like protein [Bacillus pakistanensis]MBM7584274.1 ribonuclease HI [Bacillus pakistanensis]